MLSGYLIPRGMCRCVHFSDEDRCAAIQELLNPEEVAALWASDPTSASASIPLLVASWLQESFAAGALLYTDDPIQCDAWCSPAATLQRGGGDCDDLALLAAALIEAAGLTAWVVIGTYATPQGPAGHAWVEGLDEEERGYLLEATTGQLYLGRPATYDARIMANRTGCARIERAQKPQSSWLPVVAGAVVVGAAAMLLNEALKRRR